MPSAAMMSAELSISKPRIPAWKRLGLKLKQDLPQEIAPETINISPRDKKRRTEDSKESQAEPPEKHKTTASSSISTTSKALPDLNTPSATTGRRKSVTFTQDTKIEDGDSVKQLFNSWVQAERSKDPSFGNKISHQAWSSPEPSKVKEVVDTRLPEAERRVKRVEQAASRRLKKGKQLSTEMNRPPADRPFLIYLKEYCESRDTWKFKKNHQNHLIKHAFDLSVIPSNYIHFLFQYIRGLEGGVRTRLRDTALKIRIEDEEAGIAGFPEDMDLRERRQKEYDVAVKEYVATLTAAGITSKMSYEEGVLLGLSDHAMYERVARRTRAEKILNELSMTEVKPDTSTETKSEITTTDEESSKRLRMNDGTPLKVGRKRKQRTLAVDDDSSSSEDPSSSEESSDSDSESSASDELKKGTREDTSSSSSSSFTWD